ncbi:MAG: hypothetical protein Ta2D_10480 [Rickettsiales bacterium]|nr:MAG: hypothetical protein Ta2D_10480 [Rickettsiales bacterium]
MSDASSTTVGLGSGNNLDNVIKNADILNQSISGLKADATSRIIGKGVMNNSIIGDIDKIVSHNSVDVAGNMKSSMDSFKSIQASEYKDGATTFKTPILQAVEQQQTAQGRN